MFSVLQQITYPRQRKGISLMLMHSMSKSRLFVLRKQARPLIARIRRAIKGFIYGYFVEIKTEGVGFRFTRYMGIPSLLGLNVNFTHSILYRFPRNVYFRCTKYKLLMYSKRADLLYNTATNIRNYRPSDPYKGKGLRFALAKLKFKEGKQRQR